ncbi:hypothetical protein EAI30_10160 [Romboutsia ilealis]|uniref:Uncharacterized protein n=1 Tax=Romboutsia faecis TaxID=2764597 RepID=A0ABR7JN77_9FIRM|nr:hypothetical protein [Romboutsia faecis]MBC5996384.1 hypothetical protein [Romboutsia faecis]MRN24980.1 hypothetical protein [Romboutsia ilealis]
MADIKSQYKIFNGVDYDTYHFETSEDMLVGQQQTLKSNGYRKLPGGLVIMWGEVEADFTNGVTCNFVFNFPIPLLNKVVYADAKCCYNITRNDSTYISYFTSSYADVGNLNSAKFYYRTENNTVANNRFRFKVFILGY